MNSSNATSRRWEVVLWLFFAYFLHQADKQIYSVVLKPLQAELGLSGFQAGLISTLFTVVVALMSPLAGALGDRWPQHRILWTMLMLWSVATAMTGAASGLLWLIVARSLVTAGAESFYPPVSHAYIAAWHKQTRATAIAIHQVAQYAGPMVSGVAAGWLADRFGWRAGFYVFGIPGCVLAAVMAWRLKPVPTESQPLIEPSASKVSTPGLFSGFRFCFRNRAVRQIGLAFAAVLFVSIGYGTWAPSIFADQFKLSVTQAGFQTTLWSSLSAMIGAVSGGWISDRLAIKGYSRFSLQAVSLFLAAPFLWILGTAGTLHTAILALSAIGLFRGVYEGTLAISLYDHVPAKHRSSAAAIVLLVANLLASPAAAVLGWIADQTDVNHAVRWLSVLFLVAATLLWCARGWKTDVSESDVSEPGDPGESSATS